MRVHIFDSFSRKLTAGLFLMTLLVGAAVAWAQAGKSTTAGGNPVAVGKVAWGRDLEQALAASKASGKPVFLLFQEVPGCAGCQAFGRDVLSEPGMVKAIQENFVPLLIPNNTSEAKDAAVLKRFGEPAWNYQVVRFLDAEGRDLIPRKDGVWTGSALSVRIAEVLKKTGRPAAATESPSKKGAAAAAGKTERVAFAQSCFWTGEMKLGALPGVVCTEAGYFDSHEVTMVEYDPAKTTLEQLITGAKSADVATNLYVTNADQLAVAQKRGFTAAKKLDGGYSVASVSDQKKQVQGTAFCKVKLTPEQATKVNAFARTAPQEAMKYLTAEQREKVGK
jgi:hypothetical protein